MSSVRGGLGAGSRARACRSCKSWSGALGLLLLAIAAAAGAACSDKGIDWHRDDALRLYLNTCERAPNADEHRLYTWGHADKLRRLLGEGYWAFRQFNDAQQFVYAGFNSRKYLLGFADYPLFPRYVTLVRGVYGLDNVGMLRARSRDDRVLELLTKLWSRTFKSGAIPGSEVDDPTAPALAALHALALDQVDPGFIADLPKNLDQLLAETDAQLAKRDLSDQDRRVAEGRRLGLLRARQAQTDKVKKESNISFGPAVYLSKSPTRFLGHFYNADHRGIVCTLDQGARITDITAQDTTSALVRHGVLMGRYSDEAGRYVEAEGWPSGYNQLADPRKFRRDMQERILRRQENYADSGVIRYDAPGVCRDIRLDDFRACSDLGSLLGNADFKGGPGRHPLYDFLVRDPGADPEQAAKHRAGQLRVFRRHVGICAKSAVPAQRAPVCAAILDQGFRSGTAAADLGREVIRGWVQACSATAEE